MSASIEKEALATGADDVRPPIDACRQGLSLARVAEATRAAERAIAALAGFRVF